ncbi:FAD:protein FMN transferase [Ralstonia syzygii subsp. syzygii]|nr:FAD:protein FMN transferase [Ralstonia syzygii subsp. syzygii]
MPSPSSKLRRARPLLGTLVDITASGPDATLQAALDAAFAAVERVQRLMSFHAQDSDVSRINAADAGSEVCVDAQTYCVLERAVALGELSDGAFDIATAGVLVEQGFLPRQAGTPRPAAGVTFRDIVLKAGHRVQWRRKGWIDLGGIAKGYAVDCAIAALRAHRVDSGIANAGGDLRCFGPAEPICVRRPDAPATLVPLGWLRDLAIATSSGYFAGIERDGQQIDPLVDPDRQACAVWEGSISVVATDCMTADALTKVVRLARQRAPEILDRFHAQAVVVSAQAIGMCGASLLQRTDTP